MLSLQAPASTATSQCQAVDQLLPEATPAKVAPPAAGAGAAPVAACCGGAATAGCPPAGAAAGWLPAGADWGGCCGTTPGKAARAYTWLPMLTIAGSCAGFDEQYIRCGIVRHGA